MQVHEPATAKKTGLELKVWHSLVQGVYGYVPEKAMS